MVRILRHRQTKGPVSARPHLNCRATPRLHLKTPVTDSRRKPLVALTGNLNIIVMVTAKSENRNTLQATQ
jgi:hypothetical protein